MNILEILELLEKLCRRLMKDHSHRHYDCNKIVCCFCDAERILLEVRELKRMAENQIVLMNGVENESKTNCPHSQI